MDQYITRFAPAPSGAIHIGSIRTAYFNYLAAKASKGKFILRIDDTNISRNKDEYTQIILDSMDWLGLEYDAIYYQSKRTPLYVAEARGLLNAGKAIELDNGAIALSYPDTMPASFMDEIAGRVAITETNMVQIHNKLIILKGISDTPGTKGQPTYQLASTVDDYFTKVNYIIRGTDHQTNIPKQIAIWCALNKVFAEVQTPKDFPKIAHVGLIFTTEAQPLGDSPAHSKMITRKLSKRDNAASLMTYKDAGYCPEAILNFVLRLGWSPTQDNKENNLIPKEKAIKIFLTEGNMRNSPANADFAKLDFYQRKYAK